MVWTRECNHKDSKSIHDDRTVNSAAQLKYRKVLTIG